MSYDHDRASEMGGAILEFQDLLNAEMKRGDLRAFRHEWGLTLVGMAPVPRREHPRGALPHPGPEALRIEGGLVILIMRVCRLVIRRRTLQGGAGTPFQGERQV